MRRLTFLITAGPTQEPLDPIRYLSNRSSGKMGFALAEAAKRMGHRVTLISGPVSLPTPSGVRRIDVVTARQMRAAAKRHFRHADIIIMVAAVADFRPQSFSRRKIKKTVKRPHLRLVPNPDILASLGRQKKKNQILVGFAAETGNLLKNAQRKLKEKNCDWIVVNRVGVRGTGFGGDFNKVTLLSRGGHRLHFSRQSKKKLAFKILKAMLP